MVTIFSTILDVANPFYKEVDEVLHYFKSGKNKHRIDAIKAEPNKQARNLLKKELKSICFSGEFSQRAAKNIIRHSGFACLDFDDVEDPACLRDSLQDNEYIYSAFISPSGTGVKALVKVPKDIANYKKYYEAICETFDSKLDTGTCDISRVCYECYDPDLFINHNSKEWVLMKEYTEVTRNNKYPDYFQIKDTDKKVDVIIKWFNKKFTLNAGERNNNLYKLARGLNKAGMSQNEALGLFTNFYSAGLEARELESIIKSAYKHTNEFDSLTLIDDNKIREAHEVLKKGVQKAKRELRKEGLKDDDIEQIIDFDFEDDFLKFWDVDKNGKLSLNDYKFKLFLENRGFYKVQLNDKEFTFVKVYNNIINEVNEVHIKDFVLNYVLEIDMAVYNFFAKSTAKFTEVYLNQLATKDLAMIRDTESESYLFFENGVLKITKGNTELIDYINIGGFVWQKNIIPHHYEPTKAASDFEQFIYNVSNKDDKRKLIVESALGYLLNTYKRQDEGLAIVFYDETLNDNPSGRTGKTLISKALSHCRKLVTLNGKEFNNKGQFPYQTINLDDNIICFDDMERSFKFETLFSIITGNLTLNKKNLQPIEIPFHKSPKIMFTSNYILSGVGDSHDARKIEIELFRHYSKTYKPVDEFKKLFFSQWNAQEWNAFYCYMIGNIQKYFKNGLLFSELKTGKTKKIIANTCEDFYDWCENEFLWRNGHYYTTKEILQSYNDGAREIPRTMNVSWFGRWLNMYFEFKGWKREDTTNGGVRKFMINGAAQKEDNNDLIF
jgi:SOS response regulatory protein OraA/RecX